MFSKRIKALAEFVNKDDIVLDVGCDHGYLSIYLKMNNLCKECYASDISENALSYAIANFKKYNLNIKTFVSDGFESIDVFFDTAIIAGMGTYTIINILKNEKCPRKLIIASNNDLYLLRKSLNELGYSIKKEKAIFDKGHYYVIMYSIKGYQKLSKKYLKYGLCKDKDYYNYLLNKNKMLIKKVPLGKKIKLIYENIIIKSFI